MIHNRRRGVVLVWFVLVLFVVLAIAALVVDLGYALLTQRQMQTAAGAAALEALAATTDPDQNEPDAWRGAAALRARQLFTRHLPDARQDDPDAAALVPQFSTVPHHDAPSRLLVQPAGPYLPQLEPNVDNAAHGDIVRGRYQPDAAHREDHDYHRDDFDPADPLPDAVLVRLRRSRTAAGLPADPLDDEPAVSSSDNMLPLIFGRAARIGRGRTWLARDELVVRATAVAAWRPALSVGAIVLPDAASAHDVGALPGALPFACRISDWSDYAPQDVPLASDAPPSLPICLGQTITLPDSPSLPPELLAPVQQGELTHAFLPLAPAGIDRVIGFGCVDLSVAPDGVGIRLTKRVANCYASRNAAAVLAQPFDGPPPLLAEIWRQHLALVDPAAGNAPLMAPALVR